MKKLAMSLVALGALAALFVALTPDAASAGWRRWGGYYGGWGYGPGVGVYVGPRYGYYGGYYPYAYSYRPYAYYPYWRGRHFYRRHYGWY
jgi:hypothetical protein